jgi:hypothetical protein
MTDRMPDGPAFPPPPPRGAPRRDVPYRSVVDAPVPVRPAVPTIVHRPDPAEVAAPARRALAELAEPDVLARALGPGRMPLPIIRYPRACGILLAAGGALGLRELMELSDEGGVYSRALPAVTAVALLLGAWLAIVGRPADDRGYSPPWWNVGYVAVLMSAVPTALVLYAVYL